jgi:hypothetical protein
MDTEDPYQRWVHDAAVLAKIGRELYDQSTTVRVRLSAFAAAEAVASWERDETDGLAEETPPQSEIRHRAAILALMGLCIHEGGVRKGEDMVVELPAWYVGLALAAADEDGLLPNAAASEVETRHQDSRARTESVVAGALQSLAGERRHAFFARLVHNLSIMGRASPPGEGSQEPLRGLNEVLRVVGSQLLHEVGIGPGYPDDKTFIESVLERATAFDCTTEVCWSIERASR